MPQPRFQLHLSTCIVLMFAAGGLLWLNTRAVPLEAFVGSTSYNGATYENYVTITGFGWPFTCARHFIYSEKKIPAGTYWEMRYLLGDMGVAVVILVLVCSCAEWLTRKRKTG